MVSNDALGDRGRDVRCVKCSHVWFQKSEKQHLDELIEKIQAESPDDISFDPVEAVQAQEPPKNKASPFPQKNGKIGRENKLLQTLAKILDSQKLAGVLTGLAAFVVIVFVLIQFRVVIMEAIPESTPIYKVMGLIHVPEFENWNIEKKISLDHMNLNYDNNPQKTPVLTGLMINLIEQETPVPPLEVTMFDSNHQILGKMNLDPPKKMLAKEETLELNMRLPHFLHTQATRLEIKFSKPVKETPPATKTTE